MRQLVQSRAIKNVCYFLIVAMIASIAPPFVKPAQAQLMPNYTVGVVDFVNETGVQGDLLSRLATDAVVVEMSKTNRYDVSGITRTMIKTEMDQLDLHPPLTKPGLVRLGDALQADAMLEGAIKSVQLAGSGATRRASVTLAAQMIDQASGEIINGSIQTGHSSARVGYTADDDSLIVEAINDASFMLVKTMVDYIIPEATVMMNIGADQVMLNKGNRDGLKPGMRMIVLRQREIIGYIELRTVSPTDSIAKVIKTMRGIQPEDKVRAIYDMPNIGSNAKTELLPTSAPRATGNSKDTFSKIGKFILGAAIVVGLASLFSGGRGTESISGFGVSKTNPTVLKLGSNKFSNGTSSGVLEYQILREGDGAKPFITIADNAIGSGEVDLFGLYNFGAPRPVNNYYNMTTNPSATKPGTLSWSVPDEGYGIQHTYQGQVIYWQTTGSGDTATTKYYCTPASSSIRITAIEPVTNADILEPTDPELSISDLQQRLVNFKWTNKDGANTYYMKVYPLVPGTAPTWTSGFIPKRADQVSLLDNYRSELINVLAPPGQIHKYEGIDMCWRVYCRNSKDSSPAWVEGDENQFTIGSMPPDGGGGGGGGDDGLPDPPPGG